MPEINKLKLPDSFAHALRQTALDHGNALLRGNWDPSHVQRKKLLAESPEFTKQIRAIQQGCSPHILFQNVPCTADNEGIPAAPNKSLGKVIPEDFPKLIYAQILALFASCLNLKFNKNSQGILQHKHVIAQEKGGAGLWCPIEEMFWGIMSIALLN